MTLHRTQRQNTLQRDCGKGGGVEGRGSGADGGGGDGGGVEGGVEGGDACAGTWVGGEARIFIGKCSLRFVHHLVLVDHGSFWF